MTRSRQPALRMLAALAAASLLTVLAHARTNPYDVIVERNPFNLKPIPPPVVETNQTAAAPPVKVVLTGITSMFGPSSKRVFIEMIAQEPGKTAAPPKRAMLGEGDREGDIEVVSINIEQNIVKIRNGTVESELTFEVPKPSAATPAGQVAAASTPSATSAAPASSQPIIISSSESRGGVTMAGGGSAFQGNDAGVTSFGGSTPMMAGNSGGISSYGGISPTGSSFGSANPPLAGSPGSLASIPSRTIRTPTVAQNAAVDPEQQMLMMEANRIRNQQIAESWKGRGLPPPPLPPTRLTGELYGNGPPR